MIEFEMKELPPMLLNSRMHPMAKYQKQMYWYGRTLVALSKAGAIGKGPFQSGAIEYTRCAGSRRPDHDNLVSSFKWIQDAIILAGVLEDDAPYFIETRHRWQAASPKKGLVRVSMSLSRTPA